MQLGRPDRGLVTFTAASIQIDSLPQKQTPQSSSWMNECLASAIGIKAPWFIHWECTTYLFYHVKKRSCFSDVCWLRKSPDYFEEFSAWPEHTGLDFQPYKVYDIETKLTLVGDEVSFATDINPPAPIIEIICIVITSYGVINCALVFNDICNMMLGTQGKISLWSPQMPVM